MKHEAKEILRGWLTSYLGFKPNEAAREVERVASCDTDKIYFRANRAGETIAINRAIRSRIWGMKLNAIRHAQINSDLREAGEV